jgi:hypothetical protein
MICAPIAEIAPYLPHSIRPGRGGGGRADYAMRITISALREPGLDWRNYACLANGPWWR